MKTLPVIFIGLFAIALFSSCGKSGSSNTSTGGGGGTSANSVSIANFAFNSNNITVAKGTTVTWKNNDAVTHTVTADDGKTFDSGALTPGNSFSHTFSATGTFAYHCTIHAGMTGTVVVQ